MPDRASFPVEPSARQFGLRFWRGRARHARTSNARVSRVVSKVDRAMFARFQILAAFVAAMFVASAPAPAEAKITYVKPLWQPVSEWSPPEEREEYAELHSAAMKLYSEYVENSGVQPCTYC